MATATKENSLMDGLFAENKGLKDANQEMEERLSQIEKTLAAQGRATRQISDHAPVEMPIQRIKEFLESRRPDSEFFSMPRPGGVANYYKHCLFHDEPRIDPDTQQSRRTHELWMEMRSWGGPGSELFSPIPNQPGIPPKRDRYGTCNIANLTLVEITEEDIERFHLGDTEPKPGVFPLAICIARVVKSPDYRPGAMIQVVSGETFRLTMSARYEGIWAANQRERQLQDRIASLATPDAFKTGVIPQQKKGREKVATAPTLPLTGAPVVDHMPLG